MLRDTCNSPNPQSILLSVDGCSSRIENKKAVPGVWLLTLPSSQQNNLDVIPADLLLQPAVRRNCPMIVGLAVSREEAFELVEAIALETYRETGEVKIREWLLNRIEGCE